MNQILAVILVCAATTAQPDCTRETAIDVLTAPVPSLFACMMTSQVSVARDELLGDGRYTKVRCSERQAP
ncbi:hypothetical protein [Methylobacterium sp. A54F]